ncbi:MAG TPA: TonB-dependent receptor [Bryobacteraceae bacterium]|jgi:hypothetical protein
MRGFVVLFIAAACVWAQPSAPQISGSVVNASGGEALADVAVQLSKPAQNGATVSFHANSDPTGHFHFDVIPPGDYVLRVSTVGYHVVTQRIQFTAGETKEFEIVLSPDNLARTDTVDVTAGPFERASEDSPSSVTLSGTDISNLASVLADDPLRAVQSLPGVTSNNDFDARFSVRGADYSRVGLYLDDVLLHQPFHMLQGQNVTGSGAAFNGDMVEELELHEGAFPARFGDASAGVLDVHTRDGSFTATTFRLEASASNAGIVAEGPIGKKKRGSWLVAARRSYLQYLIQRIDPNGTSLAFGLEDVQGRFAWEFSPKSKLTFYLLESYSLLDRTNIHTLGINSLATGAYDYTLANLGWHYTPSPKFVLATHAAWMREKYNNNNPTPLPLEDGFYGEWVGNVNAAWLWGGNTTDPVARLDAGASVRRLRDSGFDTQYQSLTALRVLDYWNGNGNETEGYLQQTWNTLHKRLHLTAGIRIEHHSVDRISNVLPAASATFLLTPSTRIQLGWGEYAQHQELSVLTSIAGNHYLPPLRSNQAIGAIEQRLNARTRFRAEFYNRADRDIAERPFLDPRLLSGAPGTTVFVPPLIPLWQDSERGWARGVEVYLQRVSANKFTGWVSWGWGRTGYRDSITGDRFPSDFDQRNTISIYGSYRISPSVNVSVHSSYGSGFPMPEYLALKNGVYFLSALPDQLRMAAYQRTDLRINKSWTHDRWKLALYGEILNVTNRKNYLFDSLNSYNTKTGQTSVTLDTMLPIIPSAGVLIER